MTFDLTLDRLRVSSIEAPSTKIRSVADASCGKRSTIAGTCPDSFVHGQTTETPGWASEGVRGRATIQRWQVRVRRRQPGSSAANRSKNVAIWE
jgi:hypothetical protein